MKKVVILAMLIVAMVACNKEKRFSRRLIKGENWTVSSLTVDGNSINVGGSWKVVGDNIYESVPRIEWTDQGSDATIIEWQFQEKGDSYQFNYVQLCEECDGTQLEALDYAAYAITGKYEVQRHKRKEMTFTSTETLGYKGKKVEIKISRN